MVFFGKRFEGLSARVAQVIMVEAGVHRDPTVLAELSNVGIDRFCVEGERAGIGIDVSGASNR